MASKRTPLFEATTTFISNIFRKLHTQKFLCAYASVHHFYFIYTCRYIALKTNSAGLILYFVKIS